MVLLLRRNAVGTQWVRPVRTVSGGGSGGGGETPPPPDPTPTITSRFPGDTNPKVTRTVIWGLDEFDQDGTLQHASELSRPETTAGMPAGAMRSYFNAASSLASGGAVRTSIQEQHSRGRLAWPSVMYSTSWAQAADGRNNAAYDSFIAWVEETRDAPVWFTLVHEPENQARAGTPGTYSDWLKIQQNFRARMTAYANAHGGVANYKWRNLAFAPNLTAFAFVGSATKVADIDKFIPAGTPTFWDFMAIDYYVGGQQGAIGSPAWGTNIIRAVAWCKARGATIGIAEWGVNRGDVDAAAKMQEIWNRTFDGTNDIVAWLYYNSSVGSLSAVEQRWMLTGSLLTKWVALLQDAKSVHFWDLKNPATGVNYAQPPGV